MLTDLQSMLWSQLTYERTEDGTSRDRSQDQWYLLAEEAVHQEDEDTLQAVDGEEVGHGRGQPVHLQESQKPRASQDEELSCGFKCQHPG